MRTKWLETNSAGLHIIVYILLVLATRGSKEISKIMAAILWLLFLSLLPFALLFHHLQKTKTAGRRKPPGPPGLPLIGNLHQFDSANPHESLSKLSKKYGPLMSLRFGSVPVLVISSAKTAKEALKTNDLVFSGRPSPVAFRKLSYNGLDVGFAPYGESWRQMRKISVLHLFSSKKVQQFRPVIQDELSVLVEKISNLSASSNQGINLSSLVLNLTSSITCRIAFGKKYGEDGRDAEKLGEILHECQPMFVGFFFADYFPLLGWMDKVTGMSSRLDKSFRDLDSFYQLLIEDHLNPERPDTMNGDILDVLIQMKDNQSLPFDLSWDNIKAMLMDIFTAGSDTGAALIVWAMTTLIKTPSTMERVQNELRDLVRDQRTIGDMLLEELPYFNAVIKETFRLYPPTPILLPRETIGNCTLEGFDISDKTRVLINAWAIARDPEIWQNPNDFLPERFLNSNIDLKGKDFELIPFGSGRRGCPAIDIGMSIVTITLANLLYSFNWEIPVGMKIEDIDTNANPGLTMHKKNPLCLMAMRNY